MQVCELFREHGQAIGHDTFLARRTADSIVELHLQRQPRSDRALLDARVQTTGLAVRRQHGNQRSVHQKLSCRHYPDLLCRLVLVPEWIDSAESSSKAVGRNGLVRRCAANVV